MDPWPTKALSLRSKCSMTLLASGGKILLIIANSVGSFVGVSQERQGPH